MPNTDIHDRGPLERPSGRGDPPAIEQLAELAAPLDTSYLELELSERGQRAGRRARRNEEGAVERLQDLTSARMGDAHFGYPKPARLAFLHHQLAARIDLEILRGATRHRRVPRPVRIVPGVIAGLDWVVLVPYAADILNTDPNHPWTLRGLGAALLALLGSGAAYVLLTQTGSRLRGYRRELGELAWRAFGAVTWLLIAVSLILASALAVLMYVRVAAQLVNSPDATTATQVSLIAGVFATLNGLANLAVVITHALDGSVQAAELRHAGRLLLRREQAQQRAARRIHRRG